MLGVTLPPLVTSIDQDLDSGKVMSKDHTLVNLETMYLNIQTVKP